ncbi:hypothetical protein [Hyphomonas sp.]|uniref:hypothetical protein n=1 Tax=Hyphomonas sp. TaxID=87 RepID=UPI00391BFE72
MNRLALGRKPKSIWSGLAPSARLAFGAFFIALAGTIGMLPRELFGVTIAWPYAALWGAMGWGRAGLSVRPMVLLLLFGLMQDIVSNAPLGCFAVINLAVYGLSAFITEQTDGMRDALVAAAGPVFMLAAAFLMVWVFASVTTNQPVRSSPILMSVATTGVFYLAAWRMFDLGRRPGERPGQSE